jgi:hypothetical protein
MLIKNLNNNNIFMSKKNKRVLLKISGEALA